MLDLKIKKFYSTTLLFRSLAKPNKEELHHNSTEWLEWYKGLGFNSFKQECNFASHGNEVVTTQTNRGRSPQPRN